MRKLLLALVALAMTAVGTAGAVEMRAAVMRVDRPQLAPISRYDEKPDDLGFAGAVLATEDNMTTGRFLGHSYETETVTTTPEGAVAALEGLLAEGIGFVAVMADADTLLRLSEAAGDRAVIFNTGSAALSLRSEDCRANLLHITPSVQMRADAVAQFAMWKQWKRWFLIEGSHPVDAEIADAYRMAARKFGARVVEERVFEDTGGGRRTDTGHVLVQRQLPVFTQDARNYEVLIAADGSDVFAPYLTYHAWTPRPVMGAAGLRPVSFHAAHEAWGATQFQRRFEELTSRRITEADYDTWLALRVLGEAVTRTGSANPQVLRDYILGPSFELAAFKGQKVTFRNWNGQLRQPILLYDGRITVSVSPQDGFHHQRSSLDSMGLDAPESACTAFGDQKS